MKACCASVKSSSCSERSLVARLRQLALGGELAPELHAHFRRIGIALDEGPIERDHFVRGGLAKHLRLEYRPEVPRGPALERKIGFLQRDVHLVGDESRDPDRVMRLRKIVVRLHERSRRLEHFGLVRELAEEVRELHQHRGAAAVPQEDRREALARASEIALVREKGRHDLAGEAGIGFELQEERGGIERGAEGAGADRGFDRAARDLRILHFAREAVEDLERALEVAALDEDFGDQEIEDRVGGVIGSVGGLGGLGFIGRIRILVVRPCGETRGQRQRRDDCRPKPLSLHLGAPCALAPPALRCLS